MPCMHGRAISFLRLVGWISGALQRHEVLGASAGVRRNCRVYDRTVPLYNTRSVQLSAVTTIIHALCKPCATADS